jgi:acyl carrier protein
MGSHLIGMGGGRWRTRGGRLLGSGVDWGVGLALMRGIAMVSESRTANETECRSGLPTSLAEWEAGLCDLIQGEVLEKMADFSPQTDLFEAGLDSMGIMQLIILIEERYGVVLPAAGVTREHLGSVESLAKLLQGCAARSFW